MLSLLVLLLALTRSGFGQVRITSVNEFTKFVADVNSGGTSFWGTTVLLDADLSFYGEVVDPIGKDYSHSFQGVFNGQGHTLSELKINTTSSGSSAYTGLFGLLTGSSIKNFVIDSSCSFIFPHADYVRMGGIIGNAQAFYGKITIENSVNMAPIVVNLNTYINSLCIGGIVGNIQPTFDVTVKNCANYGYILYSGIGNSIYIGGIVGQTSSTGPTFIQNCINYGSITHEGYTSMFYIGGVIGSSNYAYIDNCLSVGKLTSPDSTGALGNIVGIDLGETYLSYCYNLNNIINRNSQLEYVPIMTECSSFESDTFKLSQNITIGNYKSDTLIDVLNAVADYYSLRGYSHWALNKENKEVSFTTNKGSSPILMNYQIILLPSLGSEGNMNFNGWYTDSELTVPLEGFEFTSDTWLYGNFEENTNTYTISFDTRGGSPSIGPISARFGATVSLSSALKRGDCDIGFWESEQGDNVKFYLTMPSYNITLHAVYKCTRISTKEDFIDFSKIVNSGTDYFNNLTVLLDSDLSLSGSTLDPIGFHSKHYFRGSFDGQGHVISDLKISASSSRSGLFGYSTGSTIKNIVIDSTCSFINSCNSTVYIYMGSIIGYFYSEKDVCRIENSVNMGSVAFYGNVIGMNLYLGGISGDFYSRSNGVYMKNCANYGAVTHSGTAVISYIGGLVGFNTGEHTYIQNCLNNGIITHNNSIFKTMSIGGIIGVGANTIIENCLSDGIIYDNNANYTGGIIGSANSNISIRNSFFTNNVKVDTINGTGVIQIIDDETPTSASILDASLVNHLNKYTENNDWNKWVHNPDSNAVAFKINTNKEFTILSQAILLPSPADSNALSFSGWFTDAHHWSPLQTTEIVERTSLYGLYGVFVTVMLDGNEGDVTPTSIFVTINGKYGELPTPNRTGYRFLGWFDENNQSVVSETIVEVSGDHTLYAQWNINQYTVSFDSNGGSECGKITDDYNKPLNLPSPSRTGYTFVCWCSDPNLNDRYTKTRIEPRNITLYGLWSANNYTVMFDGNEGNVTPSSIVVTFNDKYGVLPTPNRTGYRFLGWFNENNQSVVSETIVEVSGDHTLHAQWEVIPTSQVEILFETKELSDDEIKKIIEQCTKEEFTIVRIESKEELRVIVKFSSIDKAEEFFRNANALSRSGESKIKRISYAEKEIKESFSLAIHPILAILGLGL